MVAALRLLLPFQIGTAQFSVSTLTNDTSASVSQMMEQPVRQVQAVRLEREDNTQPQQPSNTVQEPLNAVQSGQNTTVPPVTEGTSGAVNQTANSTANQSEVKPGNTVTVPGNTLTAEAEREPVTVGQVLKTIWLGGVGLMALWFLGVNLIFNRRTRRSAIPAEVEGSPIPVMVTDTIQSPCLLGFFRPRVYLTSRCAADPAATRHVLAHELTHYRHLDLLWSVLRSVCLCLHWYNPLVWLAASLSRRDCELACDEGALKKLGETERTSYGRTLIAMIAQASTPVHLLQMATTMAANKKQLKERVVMIAKKRKLYTIVTVCLLLVVCTVVGCTFAGAEIKPTVDSLSDAQKYPTKQNVESTEAEEPEQPENNSGYITVLSEGDHHRVSLLQQSGALKCEFMDESGNIVMSKLAFPDGEHEAKVTQVRDVIWVAAPNGRSAFYDTARNYWMDDFNYSNVIAFNGTYIACYYPSNDWNIRIIELFNPFADEQVALIDGMAEVEIPVTAAEFTESGNSLIVSFLDESNQETTVEVLLDEMMPLYYSSHYDWVQEDYITDEFYWPHVTSLIDESYTDNDGNTRSIAVPKIEMPGPNIEAINEKIYSDYAASYLNSGRTGYTSISYKWFSNGDVLSLVIMPTPNAGYSGQDYDVYNISISKCRLMTNEEVYAASGMENVDVRVAHAIACFAGEFYAQKNAVIDGERVSIYYGYGNGIGPLSFFDDVLDSRNILDARPYLGRNGDLYVVGCAYTMAGSGKNWGDIRVDDYYTDQLYSAWQYCKYYGQSTDQWDWVEDYGRVSAGSQVSYTPAEAVVPSVTELVDAELNANYHIPQIVLPGPNVEAINREIFQDYYEPAYPGIYAVDYEWTVCGDILSVAVVATEESGRIQMHSAYNISVSQCRLLSDAEVYAAAGLDPEIDVLHAVSMATMEALASKESYQFVFRNSSEKVISLLELWRDTRMMDMLTPYFNSENELCVFAPIYKPDGGLQLTFATWSSICVSDYPTDQLYEPLDYFYAYYHG